MKFKNKDLCIVLFGFLLFFVSNGMDIKRKLSFGKKKVKNDDLLVELIDQNELPSLEGSVVLWKKGDSAFYAVKLGERIANTSSYKIYQTENAGFVCSASELYRIKK